MLFNIDEKQLMLELKNKEARTQKHISGRMACMNASSFPKIRIFQRNTRTQTITRTTTSVQVVMTPMEQDAFL